MELRSFDNGVRVSVLGIGCGRVASISNPVPMREIEATLEAAVEAGVNLFDTADIYGQGDSERTLSRLLGRHRDRMFVVTKVGGRHSRHAGMIRLVKPLIRIIVRSKPQARNVIVRARTAMVSDNFHPRDLRRAVEGSRRRLGLDQLDGLLLHSPSLETLRNPEIHDFLSELLRSGRAAHVGASVESLPEVEAALSAPAVTILQVPLTVANALLGTAVLEHIRQRKIGVFVRDVLASLTPGSYPLREAVSMAISPDFITAAIIGVSTRHHLDELLSAIS
jgi:aryl-alcohol dehydrogenase-like predicted oxidoreductase